MLRNDASEKGKAKPFSERSLTLSPLKYKHGREGGLSGQRKHFHFVENAIINQSDDAYLNSERMRGINERRESR